MGNHRFWASDPAYPETTPEEFAHGANRPDDAGSGIRGHWQWNGIRESYFSEGIVLDQNKPSGFAQLCKLLARGCGHHGPGRVVMGGHQVGKRDLEVVQEGAQAIEIGSIVRCWDRKQARACHSEAVDRSREAWILDD